MTFDPKEVQTLVDDLQLVAKCLKGENKFPTGQSVILEAATVLTALLAEIERLLEALEKIEQQSAYGQIDTCNRLAIEATEYYHADTASEPWHGPPWRVTNGRNRP